MQLVLEVFCFSKKFKHICSKRLFKREELWNLRSKYASSPCSRSLQTRFLIWCIKSEKNSRWRWQQIVN